MIIGYELAKLFATDGYSLVLVSREATNLERVRQELTKNTAVDIEAIPADAQFGGNAAEIFSKCHERGIRLDVLVKTTLVSV